MLLNHLPQSRFAVELNPTVHERQLLTVAQRVGPAAVDQPSRVHQRCLAAVDQVHGPAAGVLTAVYAVTMDPSKYVRAGALVYLTTSLSHVCVKCSQGTRNPMNE